MAFIPIGSRQRDSTYRVPLLDSKLVRLRYAGTTAFKVLQELVAMLQPSFYTLNAVEPHAMYPNLYVELFYYLRNIAEIENSK